MHSLSWDGQSLIFLNQTLLPGNVEYIKCEDYRIVADAIKNLQVRGAPAIGAAAAFALVLGSREAAGKTDNFWEDMEEIGAELKKTRPTAINLFWAVDRMLTKVRICHTQDKPLQETLKVLEQEAVAIYDEDKKVNAKIAEYGAQLFSCSKPIPVLTHCNAGALATTGLGTALGVIRYAWREGKISRVFADETRPLLQGARLTAWELKQDHIPVTLITDNMAGWVMKKKLVQAVIVGADRITTNGDVANKIGTYSVAVLAQQHDIPFYVAAPKSTFDFTLASGDDIPIEERNPSEVTCLGGCRTAPEGIDVFNPAFDVTPNRLISAIITESGILTAPFEQAIAKLNKNKGGS